MDAVARTPRVFLVEDSALIRERLFEGFASAAIEIVGCAETEHEALASLEALDCDAIVLDLELREGNGLHVLQQVRARQRARPVVIVFTNYVYPHYRSLSMRLGADHFFDKSQDFDRVRETIEALALSARIGAH